MATEPKDEKDAPKTYSMHVRISLRTYPRGLLTNPTGFGQIPGVDEEKTRIDASTTRTGASRAEEMGARHAKECP